MRINIYLNIRDEAKVKDLNIIQVGPGRITLHETPNVKTILKLVIKISVAELQLFNTAVPVPVPTFDKFRFLFRLRIKTIKNCIFM
jgi:hypothetical protein